MGRRSGRALLPWLEGRLDAAHWFAFHNEHRLVLTRASALALLWLDGRWDPIVQMLSNALVHVVAIGVLIALLGRLLDLTRFLFFAAFALLLWAVPFGWDNTLGGFQLQFYLPDPAQRAEPAPRLRAGLEPRWVLGTLLAVLAYFSMASGALILPAAIGLAARADCARDAAPGGASLPACCCMPRSRLRCCATR
jgi:hypothetical protein